MARQADSGIPLRTRGLIRLEKKGEPRMDLYREDQLHLNAAGYTALTKAIRPLIDEQLDK